MKCNCGCQLDSTRDFLPGHDQKLRTALEIRVGGLLALRSLVEASESYVLGDLDEAGLLKKVRAAFAKGSFRDFRG